MPPLLKIALAILAFTPLLGADYSISEPSFDIPVEIRQWYRNPDGSCVQCSIGMCGIDQSIPQASTLLWDSNFGPKERGGSGPSRVARYCRTRGIKAYNITGKSTWAWIDWALDTGRGVAIGAGRAHFQTAVGRNKETGEYFVVNNNSPQRVDRYSKSEFRRLHLASGQWIVVLDYPPHPPEPDFRAWWLDN